MPDIPFETIEELSNFVLSCKRRNKLHPIVEERLKELLVRLYPDSHPVSEVAGVLGGRNDLIQFFFNKRRVLFELFFSPSQVPQDLRLLEQSTADVKIAVLLDRKFKPELADTYFRKKPEPFPYVWLSDLMLRKREAYCQARFRELIDEDAAINRLRRILARVPDERFEESINQQLADIEKSLGIRNPTPINQRRFSGNQYLALLIVGHIKKIGIPVSRLRSLFAWLQDISVITRILRLVELGFQTFVVVDSEGQPAVWTAFDLADYLFVGAENRKTSDVVVCVNKIVNDFVVEKYGFERKPVRWHLFYTYEEYLSNVEYTWEDKLEEAQAKIASQNKSELPSFSNE
jgi:hypothetical protein